MHLSFSRWVDEIAALCQPKAIHFCNGSQEEYDRLAAQMVEAGTLTPLKKRPGSYWCRSHPDDVARVEECTFICSEEKGDAGPTNNWCAPSEMHAHLKTLFQGCMKGRTLYVVPYCMGPLGSAHSRLGVELTDSPYVVLNMKLMTRMGQKILDLLLKGAPFVPGVHSVGVPLAEGEADSFWPCNPAKRVIAHFPEEPSIWSFGSGYGGNALLGKKCFALRIASVLGKKEGWLAEHMLILGVTNPEGEKRYIAAAFPSACGKTNLAMMTPALPGWKIECVGDDIAWIRYGVDGRLYAVNPEAGYFGVAPGTSAKTNPNALASLSENALFTNVALTPDGDVWWEGMGTAPPPGLTSWLGEPWDPLSGKPAAHPNSRFTVSGKQCPIYDPKAEDPHGVPLSAILFGGRRSDTLPLVFEARNWAHGVFIGASLSSETTAAAKGQIGKLRHDPFAMLPFCGYHMGDYFAHWLEMGERGDPQKLPKIFGVNWFLKGEEGRYLWSGYGENIRVLEWIFERCKGRAEAKESLIGSLPERFNFEGLPLTEEEKSALFKVDPALWKEEGKKLASYFALFEGRLPPPLLEAVDRLRGGCKAF